MCSAPALQARSCLSQVQPKHHLPFSCACLQSDRPPHCQRGAPVLQARPAMVLCAIAAPQRVRGNRIQEGLTACGSWRGPGPFHADIKVSHRRSGRGAPRCLSRSPPSAAPKPRSPGSRGPPAPPASSAAPRLEQPAAPPRLSRGNRETNGTDHPYHSRCGLQSCAAAGVVSISATHAASSSAAPAVQCETDSVHSIGRACAPKEPSSACRSSSAAFGRVSKGLPLHVSDLRPLARGVRIDEQTPEVKPEQRDNTEFRTGKNETPKPPTFAASGSDVDGPAGGLQPVPRAPQPGRRRERRVVHRQRRADQPQRSRSAGIVQKQPARSCNESSYTIRQHGKEAAPAMIAGRLCSCRLRSKFFC